jgi:hypothetical protein
MWRDYARETGQREVEAQLHHGSAVEKRTAPPLPHVSAQPVLSTALAMTLPAVAVSRPTDPSEQEADRVADTLSNSCPGCRESRPCSRCADAGTVHRAAVSTGTESGAAVEAPTGGRPLDLGTRAWFEPRLGASLGGVRIHTDGSAADAARHLHARAFTIGGHLGFGTGEYAPETAEGHRLLAHELAHVVQQSSGRGLTRSHRPPMLQRKTDHGAEDPTGERGPQGPKGEKGELEPKGEKGSPGSAWTRCTRPGSAPCTPALRAPGKRYPRPDQQSRMLHGWPHRSRQIPRCCQSSCPRSPGSRSQRCSRARSSTRSSVPV